MGGVEDRGNNQAQRQEKAKPGCEHENRYCEYRARKNVLGHFYPIATQNETPERLLNKILHSTQATAPCPPQTWRPLLPWPGLLMWWCPPLAHGSSSEVVHPEREVWL